MMSCAVRKNNKIKLIGKYYICCDELRPPFCNQFVIQGKGRVKERDLRRALAISTQVNPGVTLRAVGILGFMRWVAGPSPRFTIIMNSKWQGDSGKDAPFLHNRLCHYNGPSCEIQYIETENKTFFIFRSLHAVMDGVGLCNWTKDFFLALKGEQPTGYPDILCDDEVARSLQSERLTIPPKNSLHPTGIADAVTSDNEFRWQRFTIQRRLSPDMRARIAICLAKQANHYAKGTIRINMPVNFRNLLPEVRTMANLFGTMFMEVSAEDTIYSFNKRYLRGLKNLEYARIPLLWEWLHWVPIPVLKKAIGRSFAKEHQKGRYVVSGTISDSGVISADESSALGFTSHSAYSIPPMADLHYFVALHGFENKTEVTLALPSVLSTRGRFDTLLNALELNLNTVCQK